VDTYRCVHNGQHPYLLPFRPDGSDQSLTLKPWAQPSQILECVLVLLMAIGTGQEARSRNFNVFENLVHRDCIFCLTHVGPLKHRLASGRLAIHHDVPMICAHADFASFLTKRSPG